MKKLAVFTLLTIFVFNTVGYYVVFKISQAEARKEIKSRIKLGLSTDELTIIIIDKSKVENIQWLKKNKEFYYNNKLYDIVKVNGDSSSTTTFYCISDEKEAALFANLDAYVKAHITSKNKNNSPSKKLNDHVIKIYFTQSSVIDFHRTTSKNNFPRYTLNYLSEYTETKSPPPKHT